MHDEAFGLWGAYFWALSAARHTLAHQLRSPTGSFAIHLGLIGEFVALPEPRPDRIRHYANVMLQELERLKLVLDQGVGQLRSQLERGEPRPALGDVLADLEWLMKPMATKEECAWVLNADSADTAVPGDPIAFHHALFVIMTLAILDLEKGGRVDVTLERAPGEARLVIATSPHHRLAAWFPSLEAPSGPPGTLAIALRALELQGVRWDAPRSPDEPIALHWHLEDTEI